VFPLPSVARYRSVQRSGSPAAEGRQVHSVVSRSPSTLEPLGDGVECFAAGVNGDRLEYRKAVSGDLLVVRDLRLFMCDIVAQEQMKMLVWVALMSALILWPDHPGCRLPEVA